MVLAPILLAQGLYVRRSTARLPEPQGDRSGVLGSGPTLRLLMVGDSSAAGVGASTQREALAGQTVRNVGKSHRVRWRLIAHTGATTSSTLAELRRQPPQIFDVAITALGVNDVTSGRPLTVWKQQQRALVAELRERFEARDILLSGLPPVSCFPALPQPLRWYLGRRAERFDRALRGLAEEEGCRFVAIDFTSDVGLMAADGFHPGPSIYAEWGARLARRVVGAD